MSKYHLKTIRDIFVIIILTIFAILVTAKAAGCQNYGFNGTNVPENLTPEVRQWIIDMHPVGDTVVMVFRNDKYEGFATESDINNVVLLSNEMQDSGRVLSIIYTFSVKPEVTIEQNMYALLSFINQGVHIMAVRLGNETFFKAAGFGGIWSTYWAYANPIKQAVYGYGFPILIPVADYQDTKWNPLAAMEINNDPLLHPDYHFYWGRNELDIYQDTFYIKNDQLVKRSNVLGYDDFYIILYSEIVNSDNLSETMAWFYNMFPDKDMYITEWGAGGNVGGIGGTVGFEAANDWFLNEISGYSNVRAVCKFNGASITGYITPTGKLDVSTEPYIKRLAYFTLSNFYHSEGENIHNFTPDTVFIDKQGYTATFTGITGDWDASSGACAWWASNSVKTYEISGLTTHSVVPPMSYGYITYEPIKGCTDINATNYNPDAIEDDGSCVYPVKCLRKRVLFTSLPCREVKTKCNCN